MGGEAIPDMKALKEMMNKMKGAGKARIFRKGEYIT